MSKNTVPERNEEMIKCADCQRTGDYSNRRCLYCGVSFPSRAPLPLSARIAMLIDKSGRSGYSVSSIAEDLAAGEMADKK